MIAAIALTTSMITRGQTVIGPPVTVSSQEVLRRDAALHKAHLEHEAHVAAEAAARAAAAAAAQAAIQPAPAATYQPPQPAPVSSTYQPQPAASPSSVPSGYLARVAMAESTDNPDAVNGDHWGEYQMTENLWVLGGGNPSSYGSASAGEQTAVAQNIVANNINGGTSNWTPYDGVQP
jgi:hypothetical protein